MDNLLSGLARQRGLRAAASWLVAALILLAIVAVLVLAVIRQAR